MERVKKEFIKTENLEKGNFLIVCFGEDHKAIFFTKSDISGALRIFTKYKRKLVNNPYDFYDPQVYKIIRINKKKLSLCKEKKFYIYVNF